MQNIDLRLNSAANLLNNKLTYLNRTGILALFKKT